MTPKLSLLPKSESRLRVVLNGLLADVLNGLLADVTVLEYRIFTAQDTAGTALQ